MCLFGTPISLGFEGSGIRVQLYCQKKKKRERGEKKETVDSVGVYKDCE